MWGVDAALPSVLHAPGVRRAGTGPGAFADAHSTDIMRTYISYVVCPLSSSPNIRQVQRLIVVDAGSTGSRLHLYTLDYAGSGLPTVQQGLSHKTVPGLSAYAAQPHLAGQSLAPLINFADDQVGATSAAYALLFPKSRALRSRSCMRSGQGPRSTYWQRQAYGCCQHSLPRNSWIPAGLRCRPQTFGSTASGLLCCRGPVRAFLAGSRPTMPAAPWPRLCGQGAQKRQSCMACWKSGARQSRSKSLPLLLRVACPARRGWSYHLILSSR